MNPTRPPRAHFGVLAQNRRAMRLDFGQTGSTAARLVPQYADIRQGLCTGLQAQVICLSEHPDLPQQDLLGVPVSIQLATDEGVLYPINGVITDIQSGQSDGTLTSYRLTVGDAMSLMRGRRNMRTFVGKSVPEILETMLGEWQQRSAAMDRVFDFELLLDRGRYPKRAQTLQLDESDYGFLDRMTRHDGIWCFVKAGTRDGSASNAPVHTLVFCDDPMRLPQSAAGTVPYHYGAAVKARDSITRWSEARSLIPGAIPGTSPDHETGKVDRVEVDTMLDQGKAGNDLARLMTDAAVDRPHAGDSREDYQREGKLRMQAHERRAACVYAASDVRNLTPGFWFTLRGHRQVDRREARQREFVVTGQHQQVINNFPKTLGEQARALAEASGWHIEMRSDGDKAEVRYENTFTCVLRGVPLTPDYDPRIDLPRTEPMSAVVVGPQGEDVHCDAMGRYKLQFVGLHAEDHAHAQGAGTSGTDRDSAWVRAGNLWAGQQYGINLPLRAGMEVLVAFANGDPDRPYITAVLPGWNNMPATFSNTGSLPGNRYVSGIKTQEIKGPGHNQLRLDDTSGQISGQLASTHAHSQINLGYLTHPREEGQGTPRGEGLEARSDAHVAVRSGMAMLLSAWQRLKASGEQLEREAYLQLMQDSLDLFKSLGDYAAQHQGVAMDTQPQDALAATIKGWPDQPGTTQGDPAAQAAIGITAPAGISLATPKAVVTYAGSNVDTVAQKHVQITSGERTNLHAGGGLSLFAHQDGISAIANQGKVHLQSQADDTLIDSAKNIHWTAVDGKLVGVAKEIVFMTPEGAYLKLAGSTVEVGGNGPFISKTAGHQWAGPASMSGDLPKFDHGAVGRVPKLVRDLDRSAASGYQGEVKQATGGASPGQTNASGELSAVKSGRLEQLVVNFFKKRS
ncbi:type VI secretion system Vgr family protein [Ralstonia nicotianae]